MMLDMEYQKKQFENHVAKLTNYGNIKILDFKNPNTNNYRIRFLFEEDYYRLHISGDLGELIATNYKNMTYENFGDFVNNIGYFREKINCHNRPIFIYEESTAQEHLKELIEEYEKMEQILQHDRYDFETDEDKLEEFYEAVLEDFSEDRGIGSKGYDVLSEYFGDAWEFASDIGKEPTGILNVYMMAFKLAKEQLEKQKESKKK